MHLHQFELDTAMPADRPFPDALARIASAMSDTLARMLPAAAGVDWRARLTPVIEATLERLELVPREEFERAQSVVDRLNREVMRLEARIAALEQTAG
jgi:BMFP domain-containing protein YqiC